MRRGYSTGAIVLLGVLAAAADTCRFATDSGGQLLIVIGTVERVDGEGGCWRVRDREGNSYELRPDQAPSSILRDGVRVRLRVRAREDMVSICQVGTIVDVEAVDGVS